MADWNFNGHSGQPEEYLPNHSDGLDDPSSSVASPQPLQCGNTGLPASNLSHTVYDGSYTNFGSQLEQPEHQQTQQASDTSTPPIADALSYDRNSYLRELTGGHSQHQPGIVAPNMSHLQVPTSGGYPTLRSQLEVYTGGSALQQAPTTRLHHSPGSFGLGQNAPQEPPVFPTSLNPQAASAYGYRNSQHAAGSQYQPEAFDIGSAPNAAAYPNYHTLHSQNPAGGSYPILPQSGLSQPGVIAHNTFQSRDPAGGSYPTLGSQLQGSIVTDSAFQQVAINRLHHDSFNPAAASAYGSRDSQVSSQYQPEAFDINSAPSVAAYPNYPTLPVHLQGPAGGSHPTSGSHVVHASTVTDSVFQQVTANRSHHDSFSPAAASAYGSRDSQHVPGSQYQPEAFEIRSAPNAAAYPNHQTSCSQGGLILQLGPQSSTISAVPSRESSMSRDNDGSVPQNAPQRPALFPTALNPTPSTSDAAPQSSSSALGAHRPDATSALDSEDFFTRLGNQRPTSRKTARTLSKGVPFIRSNTSLSSARSQSTGWISMLQIDSNVLDRVKKEASRTMVSSLFMTSLYPAANEIDNLATAAFNHAVAGHPEHAKDLKAWKLRNEGQTFLSQLKANVKKIHKDSQDCARGLVTGTYDLSFEVLFVETNEIARSRRRNALELLSNDDFLDTVIQRPTNDGQFKSFRVPFGNSCVSDMSEYILGEREYRRYISLDAPDWALGISNTVLLAATITDWKIRQCSRTGWFQINDFHSPECEARYTALKHRALSLQGSDKEEYEGLLRLIRDAVAILPVC